MISALRISCICGVMKVSKYIHVYTVKVFSRFSAELDVGVRQIINDYFLNGSLKGQGVEAQV